MNIIVPKRFMDLLSAEDRNTLKEIIKKSNESYNTYTHKWGQPRTLYALLEVDDDQFGILEPITALIKQLESSKESVIELKKDQEELKELKSSIKAIKGVFSNENGD